ncbi:MAG: hypothetical protein ISR80_05780 [Nitrosopumilus sp.]|nr:hypothetical protein [Nitrosopumilus sp.]
MSNSSHITVDVSIIKNRLDELIKSKSQNDEEIKKLCAQEKSLKEKLGLETE